METVIVLIFFGLVAAMMAVTPYITRRTESFGVTIPEEAYPDPELKKLRKQYAAAIIAFSILLAAALLMAVRTSRLLQTGFALAVFADIAGDFLIYLYFHRKMKAVKAARNWATGKKQAVMVDPKFRSQKLIFSNAWFLIHASVTAATFLMTWLCYGRISTGLRCITILTVHRQTGWKNRTGACSNCQLSSCFCSSCSFG